MYIFVYIVHVHVCQNMSGHNNITHNALIYNLDVHVYCILFLLNAIM